MTTLEGKRSAAARGREGWLFSPGGHVLDATPEAESQLVYYVEKPDRTVELLTPAEFRRRVAGGSMP